MQAEKKSEIQDGGSQTGNTYISACIERSCIILTAIPMFFRVKVLMNFAELFIILYDSSER